MIESTIKYVESILSRKLTGEELLLLGVAYQDGYINGLKRGREENDDESQ
jgi:hypothetical protein